LLQTERLDERIVRGLTRAGEVQGHTALVSPQIHVPRDKLAAIVDPDRLGIADLPARLSKGRDHVLTALAEPRIDHGTVRISVCGRAVEQNAAIALMKRSPNKTANSAFALDHSGGGILHSFSERFKMR